MGKIKRCLSILYNTPSCMHLPTVHKKGGRRHGESYNVIHGTVPYVVMSPLNLVLSHGQAQVYNSEVSCYCTVFECTVTLPYLFQVEEEEPKEEGEIYKKEGMTLRCDGGKGGATLTMRVCGYWAPHVN